jgi:glutaminase
LNIIHQNSIPAPLLNSISILIKVKLLANNQIKYTYNDGTNLTHDVSKFNEPYITSCAFNLKNLILNSISYIYSNNSFSTYTFNPTLTPSESKKIMDT